MLRVSKSADEVRTFPVFVVSCCPNAILGDMIPNDLKPSMKLTHPILKMVKKKLIIEAA